MFFAWLPPEVNSGLMYSGPGAGSMLAAAAGWDGLATELHSAAASYESVIAELTDQHWQGPSSAAMAAAAAPQVGWLTRTAARAELTATQARSAAAAYEEAFAMTVPPSVVAANRAQLAVLVATNILGQNTAAIAANEAHYGEMWAQDATAMYDYAATAAAVTADVPPFEPLPGTTGPAGSLSPAATLEAASGESAGIGAHAAPPQLASPAQVAAPAQAELPWTSDIVSAADFLSNVTFLAPAALALSSVALALAGAAMHYAELDSREILEAQDVLSGGQRTILDAIADLKGAGAAGASGGGSLSAGLGQAVSVGKLSVPPSWAAAAPDVRAIAYTSPITTDSGPGAGGLGTAFSQMALAGMAGSALAGGVSSDRRQRGTSVTTEHPASPQRSAEPAKPPEPEKSLTSMVDEIDTAIRKFGKLRDAGLLTDEEFTEQKKRLLGR